MVERRGRILYGTAAPATTPEYEGVIFVDTVNDVAYIATGTSSSADWDQVSGGGSAATVQTWTPDVAFATPGTSSIAYGAQRHGRYFANGKLISYFIDINFTPTIGTASGNLLISLPVAASASARTAIGSCRQLDGNLDWQTRTMLYPNIDASATDLVLQVMADGVAGDNRQAPDFTNAASHRYIITGQYESA